MATSTATGGRGGDANRVSNNYTPVINASAGGSASSSISVVGPHAVRATVSATGGAGGHAEVLGSGGAGGVASVQPAFAQSLETLLTAGMQNLNPAPLAC